MKIIVVQLQDRENRIMADVARKYEKDEKFSGRIKELEAKFKDSKPAADKRPKDLRRAIGRIDKGDWNMAQIERKIEENRMGKGKAHGGEKVPKWSHDKFVDKVLYISFLKFTFVKVILVHFGLLVRGFCGQIGQLATNLWTHWTIS